MLDKFSSESVSPVSQHLWGVVDCAKEDRLACLITHSVSEAQHVAKYSQGGVNAKGKLRARKGLHSNRNLERDATSLSCSILARTLAHYGTH